MRIDYKNEKGYSLILIIFVMFLFSLLTVSLMSFTLSGTKRNHINQSSIQATSLANKGVEFITARINTDLKNGLTTNGLTRSQFIDLLNNTLNKYKTKLNSSEQTGNYNVYISTIADTVDNNGNPNPLRKRVTFISTGIVDGIQKQVSTDVDIGAQPVLETLKYAVGANCADSKCNQFPGEGNMFLHGGVTIQGDFKVDNNIITTDRGYAYLNGEKWVESQYPSVLPIQGETTGHLVLGGKIYSFTNNPPYNNHITSLTGGNYSDKTSNISSAFYTGQAPTIVSRSIVRDTINISDQKSVFYFSKNDGVQFIETSKSLFSSTPNDFSNDINMQNYKVYPRAKSCLLGCSYSYDDQYTFTKNNYFKSFATDGSLTIESSTNAFKLTKFDNGAYIEKNLTIGNGSNSYDINSYDKIQIDGPLFVNGNVTIKGANAQFNSIMYVMGDVTIENSQLSGYGNNGSLIIFAKGNINIRNNSVNQDTPSDIKGFFYSEQALEMFGVGSNIRINGGLSARRIVLNGIRGKASSSNFTGAQQITSKDYFEGKANQVGKNSRLQIIYDPQIMNTYADIKSREPIIKSIDPPQLISRSN
jgi:hypothetical protein